jgi:hypothetical protein
MMFVAEGSLVVSARPEQLYDHMVDPANLDLLMGVGLADFEDIQPMPGGGIAYRCLHRWENFPIWAQGATTILSRGHRIVVESLGGIDMISTWSFDRDNDRTRVTFTIEVPDTGLLTARVSAATIDRQIRSSIDASLASIARTALQFAPHPLGQLASTG